MFPVFHAPAFDATGLATLEASTCTGSRAGFLFLRPPLFPVAFSHLCPSFSMLGHHTALISRPHLASSICVAFSSFSLVGCAPWLLPVPATNTDTCIRIRLTTLGLDGIVKHTWTSLLHCEILLGTCGGVLFVRGPSSSAEVRVIVINDIKEVAGVRQQEVQEVKGDEEIGDEMNGEVEEVTQHTHETWR